MLLKCSLGVLEVAFRQSIGIPKPEMIYDIEGEGQ